MAEIDCEICTDGVVEYECWSCSLLTCRECGRLVRRYAPRRRDVWLCKRCLRKKNR